MNKRTVTVLMALVLACGIFLVGGVSLTRGVAQVFAARAASRDALKPGPTTSARAGAVAELKVTIKEWDVPTKGAHPHDPALAPDGSLWFTEQLQNKLGRLDPASGTFKEYVLKIEDSGPHGLVLRG